MWVEAVYGGGGGYQCGDKLRDGVRDVGGGIEDKEQ